MWRIEEGNHSDLSGVSSQGETQLRLVELEDAGDDQRHKTRVIGAIRGGARICPETCPTLCPTLVN